MSKWNVVLKKRTAFRSVVDNDGITIAEIWDNWGKGEANANLIASAPDMLECLKQLRYFMSLQYGKDDLHVQSIDRILNKINFIG